MQVQMQNEVIYVQKVQVAKQIFIQDLGYTDLYSSSDPERRWALLESTCKLARVLLVEKEKSNEAHSKGRVYLKSSDCLKDFYFMKKAEVKFINKPYYLEKGLAVDFVDTQNNLYTLLEEREYSLLTNEGFQDN